MARTTPKVFAITKVWMEKTVISKLQSISANWWLKLSKYIFYKNSMFRTGITEKLGYTEPSLSLVSFGC